MIRNLIALFIIITGVLILSHCSKEKADDPALQAARFLPDSIPAAGLFQSGEPRIYVGNSLWEYIPGGAELYYSYNFIEVATSAYRLDTAEVVADIYRFTSSNDAYGLYSMLRPENPTLVSVGVEGCFISPLTMLFTKGAYVVRLLAYNENSATNQALTQLAKSISDSLPGATSRPNAFILFPVANRIGLTDRYFATDFLGHKFLPHVFTLDFFLEPDTAILFLSGDPSGEKFLKWSEYARSIGSFEPVPDTLSYDSGFSFIIADNFYGRAAVGLKKGKLVGMVNFSPSRTDFLAGWLDSFQ